MSEQWLGPGEMARRLGVTPKALRVYEREGLVEPARTASGWRVYGPMQAARLHQIMALRGLGVPLKRIKTLLVEGGASLADVLSLQRDSLTAQRSKLDDAIALLGLAVQTLDAGKELSLDDLTHLTQETVMQQPTPMKALSAKVETLLLERLPGYDLKAWTGPLDEHIQAIGRTKEELRAEFLALAAEGSEVMRTSSDESEAAKGFVRRFVETFAILRQCVPPEQDPARAATRAAITDAMSDPNISERLPFDPGFFDFVRRVTKGMRDRGELA